MRSSKKPTEIWDKVKNGSENLNILLIKIKREKWFENYYKIYKFKILIKSLKEVSNIYICVLHDIYEHYITFHFFVAIYSRLDRIILRLC